MERVRAVPEKLTRKEPSESVVVRRRPVVVTLAKVPVRAAAEAKKPLGRSGAGMGAVTAANACLAPRRYPRWRTDFRRKRCQVARVISGKDWGDGRDRERTQVSELRAADYGAPIAGDPLGASTRPQPRGRNV